MSDWDFLNRHRVTVPDARFPVWVTTTAANGFNGFFRFVVDGRWVKCLATDTFGWQHVSISLEESNRLPTWGMMCQIKELFWEPEDWVVQFHPATSEYVNNYRCLHLWRCTSQAMPTPPHELVGIKGLGELP